MNNEIRGLVAALGLIAWIGLPIAHGQEQAYGLGVRNPSFNESNQLHDELADGWVFLDCAKTFQDVGQSGPFTINVENRYEQHVMEDGRVCLAFGTVFPKGIAASGLQSGQWFNGVSPEGSQEHGLFPILGTSSSLATVGQSGIVICEPPEGVSSLLLRFDYLAETRGQAWCALGVRVGVSWTLPTPGSLEFEEEFLPTRVCGLADCESCRKDYERQLWLPAVVDQDSLDSCVGFGWRSVESVVDLAGPDGVPRSGITVELQFVSGTMDKGRNLVGAGVVPSRVLLDDVRIYPTAAERDCPYGDLDPERCIDRPTDHCGPSQEGCERVGYVDAGGGSGGDGCDFLRVLPSFLTTGLKGEVHWGGTEICVLEGQALDRPSHGDSRYVDSCISQQAAGRYDWQVRLTGFLEPTDPLNACPADLNGDGVVDGEDAGLLLVSWGTADPAADLDGNGIVDSADYGLLLSAWGPCCP